MKAWLAGESRALYRAIGVTATDPSLAIGTTKCPQDHSHAI